MQARAGAAEQDSSGAWLTHDWSTANHWLADYVVVAVGPVADDFWQRQVSANPGNLHSSCCALDVEKPLSTAHSSMVTQHF